MAARVDIFETFPRLLARSVHEEAQRDPSLLPLGPKWPRHMHSSAHGAAIVLFACLLLLRVRAMQVPPEGQCARHHRTSRHQWVRILRVSAGGMPRRGR